MRIRLFGIMPLRQRRKLVIAIRKSTSLIVTLAFTTALFAADPFVGTWKLNLAKSKYPVGMAPKDETVVISDLGRKVEVTVTETTADGSRMLFKYTVPQNGGPGQVQEGPFNGISWKIIGARVRDISTSKDGKELSSHRGVVSKDGNKLRVTVNGSDAHGNPIPEVEVFEKQ